MTTHTPLPPPSSSSSSSAVPPTTPQPETAAAMVDKAAAYKTRRSFTSTRTTRRRQDSTTPVPSLPLQYQQEKLEVPKSMSFFSMLLRGGTRSRAVSKTAPIPQTEFTPVQTQSLFPSPSTPATPATSTVSAFPDNNINNNNNKFSQTPFTPTDHRSLAKARLRNNSVDQSTLFLAYEKAIKAASLTIPMTQADLIIKHSKGLKEWQAMDKRPRFGKKSIQPKALGLTWAQKLFLLVPGYVLQYHGDGSYHRDPEKMLKLNPESVAFVTDVLEGKHFVLQVNCHKEGAIHGTPTRTTLLSKFTTRSRLDASVLLLVFDSAEEMQDWLVKIRNEVARLGGQTVEEHLTKPKPKAVEETQAAEDLASETASSRRYSRTSRPSEDLATSMSTDVSQDENTLNDLRSSRSYLGGQKVSRPPSSDTSPERCSESSTTRTTRARSNTLGSMVSVPAEARLARSRPTSTLIDVETASEMTTERAPSPSMTAASSCYAPRRSSLVPSTPIPVPTRQGSESADYALPLYAIEVSKRKTRTKRKSPLPLASDSGYFTPLSTSLPNHTTPSPISQHFNNSTKALRPRPVSMTTAPMARRMTSTDDMRAFSISTGQMSPGCSLRARNLKRRSMGTLTTPVGPPMHPPPSAPLPKLPGTESCSDITLNKSGASLTSIPPVPPIPTAIMGQAKRLELRQLNTRHSFHTIRTRDNMSSPTMRLPSTPL